MVSLAVFLVVGGAAFQLVQKHMPLFTSQQNQAALNFSLRNAAAQMQIDLVNAGSGYFPGADIAAWPLGVTITNSNSANTNCYNASTHTYGPTCFDTINIVTAAPVAHPTDNGANCVSTTSSTLFATPVSGTLDALAASFKKDDVILVMTGDGLHLTTVKLTSDGQVTGGKVKLAHNPTGANGVNSSADDPYGISTDADSNKLGDQYCSEDWILNLNPSRSATVTYYVDATDQSNPKLMRKVAGTTPEAIAEQIIGFKVGASVKVDPNVTGVCGEAASEGDVTDSGFRYNAAGCPTDNPPGYKNDWYLIRAVKVTIIGRTPPAAGPTTYRNNFDQGPYRVEAVSVVVNPRNLSMND